MEGRTPQQATAALDRAGTAAKNELLHERGVNFNDTPSWHRRGCGIWWRSYEKAAHDPRTGAAVTATRRALHVERELPMKDDYRRLVERLVGG